MSPIFLGLSDYRYRKYSNDMLYRYFNHETESKNLALKSQPSYFSIDFFDMDGLII